MLYAVPIPRPARSSLIFQAQQAPGSLYELQDVLPSLLLPAKSCTPLTLRAQREFALESLPRLRLNWDSPRPKTLVTGLVTVYLSGSPRRL